MRPRSGVRGSALTAAACALALGGVAATTVDASSLLVVGTRDQQIGQLSPMLIGADGRPVHQFALNDFWAPSSDGLVVTPDARHAFDVTGGAIAAFDLLPDSVLTQRAGYAGELKVGGPPSVSPDGRFLYVAAGPQAPAPSSIAVFGIAADGSLAYRGSTPSQASGAITISPDGRYLFAGHDLGPDNQTTSTFAIAEDGTLSAVSEVVGPGVSEMAVSPDGRHLYGAGGYHELVAFAISDSGQLTTIATLDGRNSAQDVVVAPDGRRLYAVSAFGDLATYALGEDGIPVRQGPLVDAGGQTDNSIALNPSGRYLYGIRFYDRDVRTFALSSGTPAPHGAPVPSTASTPASHRAIVVTPDQAPSARFDVQSAPVGQPTRFDGAASTDADGTVVRYDWDFGDGATAGDAGPTPAHVYAQPGTYAATLTVTDDQGTSTDRLYTGHMTLRNGGPSASATRSVVVSGAPASPIAGPTAGPAQPPGNPPLRPRGRAKRMILSGVRLDRRRVSFKASTSGSVIVTVAHRLVATRGRGKPTFRTLVRRTVAVKHSGRTALRLRRALPRGAYRVTLLDKGAGHGTRPLRRTVRLR